MSHDRPPQLQGPATVVRRQQLTPHLLRLHFHAPALAGMAVQRPAHALRLWFGPRSPDDAAGGDKSHRRVFTLRQFDPARAMLAVDFLLHGHGLAAQWAAQAQPGDVLEMAGPRSGFAWAEAGRWLFAAVDESALPALATLMEQAPAGRPVQALVRLHDRAEQPYLDAVLRQRPWCRAAFIVATEDLSMPAPKQAPAHGFGQTRQALDAQPWLPGPGQAFVAGESDWVSQVRACLEGMAGVDWRHIHASGYWKRGMAGQAHA